MGGCCPDTVELLGSEGCLMPLHLYPVFLARVEDEKQIADIAC